MAGQVLLSGNGLPLPESAQAQQIAQLEAAQPAGTRMDWALQCGAVTVPAVHFLGATLGGNTLVSSTAIAGTTANLINQAQATARQVPAFAGIAGIPAWPGQPLAQAQGGAVHVRWVTDAPWSAGIVAALGGLATALVAGGVFDVAALPAAALGALVAVGIYAVVRNWQFIQYAVQHPVQALSTVGAPLLIWGGVVVGGVLVLRELGL